MHRGFDASGAGNGSLVGGRVGMDRANINTNNINTNNNATGPMIVTTRGSSSATGAASGVAAHYYPQGSNWSP